MSTLLTIAIQSLYPNPHRRLDVYPYNAKRISSLMLSIKQVGLWEGVIARPVDDHYQLAFGHHRIEASRQMGLESVPIIVRDLTDLEMLQFMGRENMEEYNTDFLLMLNTWESAVKFLNNSSELQQPGKNLIHINGLSGSRPQPVGNLQAIDIARVLGWTRIADDSRDGSLVKMAHVAYACNAAYSLICGGYNKREDFDGLTVSAAQEICQRAVARIEQLEKLAQATKRPPAELKAAKKHIGKAVKTTAEEYIGKPNAKGEVPPKRIAESDLRSRVDSNAYRFAGESKKQTPLFAIFAKDLTTRLDKMLKSDSTAEKLAGVEKSIGSLERHDDKEALGRVVYMLDELSGRAINWRKRLTSNPDNVIPFKVVAKGA